MTAPARHATLADLARFDGKAELINGRIVDLMAPGMGPCEAAANIYSELRGFARTTGAGRAFTDGIGYAVPILPSGRESFSPDASFHTGPFPANRIRFISGSPVFAVEVRSEGDYGPAAEAELATKRDDYFQAGTLVVWDVDTRAETVTAYRDHQPPVTFRRGQVADAEPAVPGWRMSVDDVFA